MQLSSREMRFLERRARLLRTWRYVGTGLLIGVAGFAIWLFLFEPMLANPFFVLSRLDDGSISRATMALSTVLLPVMFLMCMLLALTILLLIFAAFSNERKYLAIIRKAVLPSATPPGTVEPE